MLINELQDKIIMRRNNEKRKKERKEKREIDRLDGGKCKKNCTLNWGS